MEIETPLERRERIVNERYANLIWSTIDSAFRKKNFDFETNPLPFCIALQNEVRSTVFGKYLDFFNYQQNQDKFFNENKLAILKWDIDRFDGEDKQEFTSNNYIASGLYDLLVEAVDKLEVIGWDYLYKALITLKLVDCDISRIDKVLKRFVNLQALVLCGNKIREVCGKYLPKKLIFLELFCNNISDLNQLVHCAPDGVLHLGLGRNMVRNELQLHLLANSFFNMRSLDLSNNELYDLNKTVRSIANLRCLKCLNLEGNPCYTRCSYKTAIVRYFPKLLYLDNVQVLDSDKIIEPDDAEVKEEQPAIIFTCHRIIGLAPPPKQKNKKKKKKKEKTKFAQTYHLEITLPFLEEIPATDPEPEPDVSEAKLVKKKVKTSKSSSKKSSKKGGKTSKSSTKSSKSSKSKRKKKETSVYEAPNEIQDKKIDTSFKTPRIFYSKLMQFPENAIVVKAPDNDLKKLRDTFRTSVNVKLVYLEIEMPGKKKKGKGKGKKKKSKGSKDSKSSKSSKDKKSKSGKGKKGKGKKGKDKEQIKEEEPKEVILKKITLASFFCDLHPVNWSDKTVDFYWARHPAADPKAIAVEGDLRAVQYSKAKEKGKKKKKGLKGKKNKEKKKGKKGKKKKGSSSQKTKSGPDNLPKILTCQVGFGLKRDYSVD